MLFYPFQYNDVEVIIRFLLEIWLDEGIKRKYWGSSYTKKERYASTINSQTMKTEERF